MPVAYVIFIQQQLVSFKSVDEVSKLEITNILATE